MSSKSVACLYCGGEETELRVESRENVGHECWYCYDCRRRFLYDGEETFMP